MKTIAVVPMKLNNRRLPQKNTKCFTNGDPLCTYVLRTLKKIPEIESVYVYCSNPGIQRYLPEGIRFLPRSTQLDTDTTQMNEVLKCFARNVPADIYVMTHATAPFISATSIWKGLSAVTNGNYDSSFAVKRLQDFLWKDGHPLNYDLSHIPRTQDLPVIYEETSGFYIFRSEVLKKYHRRIGVNPYMVEISQIEGIDIDEEEDFMIADAVFNRMKCTRGGGIEA